MKAAVVRQPAPRLDREARIDAILQAARDAFCASGYEHTAVANIAANLGIVEGTIYKYFDSKRALLLAVLERWYEQMFGDYARELARIDGARQRLCFLIGKHLASLRDNPSLCRLMFHEVRSGIDYRGSRLHEMNRRYTDFLVATIADGAVSGEFRDDLPLPLLRDLVFGGIEHHAWNYMCGRGELDVEGVADQITTVLCDGIAAAHTRIAKEATP